MRANTVLGEVLPVVGTIGLLGLWLYQQTAIERRATELQDLATARGVYQSYQSLNALFNAVNQLLVNDKTASDQLRVYQTYNYELGLTAIERVLPDEYKANIPPPVNAYDSTVDVETKLNRTQQRLEVLQERLTKRETAIRRSADAANRLYLYLYVALSAVAVLGAVCKVIENLS